MSELVSIVIKWLIPALCGALFGSAVTMIKKIRKRDEALEDGIECLLRAELIRAHKEYKRKGFCPIYARESITKMYDAYHGLGGDGVITGLKNEVLALPTEEPQKEESSS